MHIQTFKQTQNSHQCSFQNPASIDFENPNLTRLKFRYSWHEYPTSNQFSISYKFSIISLFGQLASSIVMRCGNFQVPFYCLIKDQATKSKVYWISILLYSLLTSDWNDCSIRHQSFFFLQQRNPRGTGSVSFDSLDSLHKKWINQSLIYNSLSISFSLDLYWTNWKEVTEKQSSPKCQTRQIPRTSVSVLNKLEKSPNPCDNVIPKANSTYQSNMLFNQSSHSMTKFNWLIFLL